MRIAIIAPSYINTNIVKCASGLRDCGAYVHLFCFKRKTYPASDLNFPVTILGIIDHRKYLKRFPKIVTAAIKNRRSLLAFDCIYAFNWEMALLAIIAVWGMTTKPVIVLQTQDIRTKMLDSGILGRALRFLERRVLSRINLLSVSSIHYLKNYYVPIQKLLNCPSFVLENKLFHFNSSGYGYSGHRSVRGSHGIVIGYFGLIRCWKSCDILQKTVDRGRGKILLYLRGIPRMLRNVSDLNEYAARSEHITYEGEYRTPEDLVEMFSRIDILWIASPYEDDCQEQSAWRWKRTNRFYMGCFFGKPMIAWKNTADGDEVEKYDLGLTIEPKCPKRAIEDILGITSTDLERWQSNIGKLSREVYIYTDEHQRLYGIIQGLRKSVTGNRFS